MSDAGVEVDTDSGEVVKFTLRVPRSLYEKVKAYAQGAGNRPASKMNPAVLFLLERGLTQIEGATDIGATEQ